MNGITRRFFEYLSFKNITAYGFSKLNPKITTQKISNFKSGRNNITLEVILALSKTYANEVNLDWLLTGKGQMTNNNSYQIESANIKRLPFITAKTKEEFLKKGTTEVVLDFPLLSSESSADSSNAYICFEIDNEAMNDGTSDSFLQNDLLLAKKIDQKEWTVRLKSNVPFLFVHSKLGLLLRRPKKSNADLTYLLQALHPAFEEIPIQLDELQALYQIVDLKRTLVF